MRALTLDGDGAQLFAGAASACLEELRTILAALPQERAGVRIRGLKPLASHLAGDGSIGTVAAQIAGPAVRPVRAVLFDKSATTNWTLGWHQDRTVCVAERREVAGFGPWSVKQGLVHVEPPFEFIERMMTLRVHLDDVPEDNAPLLVAPRSHLLGKVPVNQVEAAAERCGMVPCLAEAGDVWAYRTPIVHASKPATAPRRRRVLQVDYSADDLPAGLGWLGI